MRVDAWVIPFVEITYKANNAQAIIPFGIRYGYKPITMLHMMFTGWINREQRHMIDYLREENSILRNELLKATGRTFSLFSPVKIR